MNITREGLVEAIYQSTLLHGRATSARSGAEQAATVAWDYLGPLFSELYQKLGDLEVRNQRLWDEMAELDRELDDITDWLPAEDGVPDVTVTVELSKERPKPPPRGGW